MTDDRSRSFEGKSTRPSIFYAGFGPDKPVATDGAAFLPLPLRLGTEASIFWIGFYPAPAELSEIVGAARKLSDVTIGATLKLISSRGQAAACHKGCHAACCKHLMVSLSVPEAMAMIREVAKQDSQSRETAIRTCQTTAGRIRERFQNDPAFARQIQGRDGILDWYMDLDIECPFLRESCCSIYDRRPITCRECLVTKPESFCIKNVGQVVRKVHLPIRFASVLTQLSRDLYGTEDELIVLPCVFDWFANHQTRYRKTWPTEFLVRRFIEIAVSQQRRLFTIAPVEPVGEPTRKTAQEARGV